MLLKVKPLVCVPRRFVQALFVSQRNAVGNLRALWPIFDYKNRLENRAELEVNIKRRGLLNKIDINNLYAQWTLYKSHETRKDVIEKRRAQLSKTIGKLKSAKSLSAEEHANVEKYQQEARSLRSEYEDACQRFYEIEENFNNSFLALPNQLLPNTSDELQIVHSHRTQYAGTTKTQHHLQYEHCIEFINDYGLYFLRNEASIFDLHFPLNCLDYFQQNGFIQFRNPDFAKTIIIEGAGHTLDSVYEITHDFHENCSNLVHLVGNGCWLSFLGFIAKIKADKALLPMQFVTTGKIYQPTSTNNNFGLFDAVQSTAVQIFLAGTEKQMKDKFDETLELISQIYKSIDIHFRIVHMPANQLQSAACFGARIEMYSPHLEKYIEIGNLSNYSDYISRRLRFQCEKDETNSYYKPHILSGTVCNVTKLLAIILETHDGTIPKSILTREKL